jgi:DNA-binding NarL/FixJ family response regulator
MDAQLSQVRVLVVDDHALFRRGLVDLLASAEDVEVVGEAGGAIEALEKASALAPDVVVMDVRMPGVSGDMAVAMFAEQHPETKVLMLTVSEEPESLFQAMAAGARGYVLKTASPSDILEAFRQVSQGWVVISPAMAPLLLKHLTGGRDERPQATTPSAEARSFGLTPREKDVLTLVARAYTNGEIAGELDHLRGNGQDPRAKPSGETADALQAGGSGPGH